MRPAWAIARPAARRKREQRRPEAIRGGVFASGRVGFVPSQTARFGQSREGRILRCWGCPPTRGGVARGNPPWQVGRNAANLLCTGGGLADAMRQFGFPGTHPPFHGGMPLSLGRWDFPRTQCRQFALRRRRIGRRNAAACPVPSSGRRRAPHRRHLLHRAKSIRRDRPRFASARWEDALAGACGRSFPPPRLRSGKTNPLRLQRRGHLEALASIARPPRSRHAPQARPVRGRKAAPRPSDTDRRPSPQRPARRAIPRSPPAP